LAYLKVFCLDTIEAYKWVARKVASLGDSMVIYLAGKLALKSAAYLVEKMAVVTTVLGTA